MSDTQVGKIEFGPSHGISSANYLYIPPQRNKCLRCDGKGSYFEGEEKSNAVTCTACEGKGYIEMPQEIKSSQFYYTEIQPILRVKVEAGGFLPKRAHEGDAGIDFFSPMDFAVSPRSDFLLPLNIRTAFPSGWVLWMAEKSGVATKKKLDMGACIVDSGYRGIVHAHVFNNSDFEQSFKRGDKVVQGVLVKCCTSGQPIQVDDLDDTNRGNNGFGSTGA